MKLRIDGELCTGHGRCWSVAAEVYEADERGYNAAAGGVVDVPRDLEAAAMRGLHSCPEGAISIVDDGG